MLKKHYHIGSKQLVNKHPKETKIPSFSKRPFSCHASSSFPIAIHSPSFQPENPTWWIPTLRTPRGQFQELAFLDSTFSANHRAPPIASIALINLYRSIRPVMHESRKCLLDGYYINRTSNQIYRFNRISWTKPQETSLLNSLCHDQLPTKMPLQIWNHHWNITVTMPSLNIPKHE